MKVLSIKKEFSLTELNRPTDWNNLTGMAKKHIPIIEAPDSINANEPFLVKIKVGGIDGVEHPNTLSHWINWIVLYAGERLVFRGEFGPELSNKYVLTVNITLNESSLLKVQSFCNLHGVWEGKTKKVTIK